MRASSARSSQAKRSSRHSNEGMQELNRNDDAENLKRIMAGLANLQPADFANEIVRDLEWCTRRILDLEKTIELLRQPPIHNN